MDTSKSSILPPVNPLKVLQSPFCGELRSKKFYMLDQLPTKAEDYWDNSGYMFCYLTQMPIGPDGKSAEPECCGPDRKCYRSAFEKPKPYKAGDSASDFY